MHTKSGYDENIDIFPEKIVKISARVRCTNNMLQEFVEKEVRKALKNKYCT